MIDQTSYDLTYDQFVGRIQARGRQQNASMSWSDVERALAATLGTLAERISEGEARDLAAQLPSEVRGYLTSDRTGESFDVTEFVRRVAERENLEPALARRHVEAVLHVIGRTVRPRERGDLESELPREFHPFLH